MQNVTSAGLLAGLLMLAACGDPAPGEGIGKRNSAETMPEIVPAAEAIRTAAIPTIDLHTMDEAEYEKVLSEGQRCRFLYTSGGGPVLAASATGGEAATGVVKIHGKLIELKAERVTSFDALLNGATFVADGLRVQVIPDADENFELHDGRTQREADAILELEQGLKVGYRGWYACEQETAQQD